MKAMQSVTYSLVKVQKIFRPLSPEDYEIRMGPVRSPKKPEGIGMTQYNGVLELALSLPGRC